jgi:hemolysin activation/secretion protein
MDSGTAMASPMPVAGRRFDIFEYVIDGNTVLQVPEVEEAVYPFLGEQREADDVDKAREALERLYQSKGFQAVQVSIPEQGIESGIIHIQVTENPVGRLRIVDSRFHSLQALRENAPSLAEGKVLNTKDVQADIVALNQQPNVTITPQLKAGRVPGTVDVDLQVQDHPPFHASVEVNNQYGQATSELRTVASVGYDNLWQLGHSVNLSYLIAPQDPDDAKVLSGSYLARIPRTSVSLLGYAVKSDSNVAALAGTDVVGKGTIFGARAIVSLPGTDMFFQSLTLGVDRKNLTQNVITSGVPSNAPILYYPASIAYSGTWQQGEEATHIGASLNFALPAGSGSSKFDAQRFDALRQYFYVKGDASRSQPLPLDLILYGRAAGQITEDSLLSSEQLSAGGENTVRGYLEAERLGDYGALGTLELRSPNFGTDIYSGIKEWRVLAFVDGAILAIRNPLPGQLTSYRIAGAGIGTRFNAFDRVNAAFDVAYAIADGAVTQSGTTRLHFRVWSGF